MKPQAAALRSRSIGHGDALPQTKPNKTLILVHGRGFKPARTELETLWLRALRAGLQRDAPDAAAALDRCTVRFVYYGDESRDVLAASGRRYDPALDLADLNNTVAALAALSKTKQFRREHYERLPGKTPLKEFLADIGAPALSVLGLKERALERFMPELADYWRPDRSTLRAVDSRLRSVVGEAIERGDDVALVSHCVGCVIAYNALLSLSRDVATQSTNNKVALWLTLGAPLGDESVKRRLDGAAADARGRYPANVVAWTNVAAEDDYVCHDDSLADDYRSMLEQRLISRIEDVRIYNLAVRYGRSNPHCAFGYLIHPRVSRAIARWLGVETLAAAD
jgi:hypothetical protein